MNIGICISGVSYGNGRDCFHCYNSINNNLIKPFKDNVNIYLSTYHSEKENSP